jgi:hypothetical protein
MSGCQRGCPRARVRTGVDGGRQLLPCWRNANIRRSPDRLRKSSPALKGELLRLDAARRRVIVTAVKNLLDLQGPTSCCITRELPVRSWSSDLREMSQIAQVSLEGFDKMSDFEEPTGSCPPCVHPIVSRYMQSHHSIAYSAEAHGLIRKTSTRPLQARTCIFASGRLLSRAASTAQPTLVATLSLG